MIKSIKGTLVSKEPTRATVQIGGIALELSVPVSTYCVLPETPGPVSLFTYLHVREDMLKLFGFATEAECDLFTLLIGVNKVGPAVALQVLSSCSVEDFRRMVAGGDVASLSSMVKGVGKKTAERMVLELKDKIGGFSAEDAVLQQSQASPDAVKALVELGSTPSAARKEVREAIKQTGADAPVDVILRTVFDNR